MKKYTKPALMTLSVSADVMLCSGCGAGALRGTPAGEFLLEYFDDGDNRLDWSDFGEGLFSTGDSCANPDPMVEGYCEHTANTVIIWS